MVKLKIEDYRLTVEIKNSEPVELIDLTNSLLSLGDEYKQFIINSDGPVAGEEIKLYIKEIKTGSIITDLIAIAPGTLPMVTYAKTVIGFSEHLNNIINFFLKNHGDEPVMNKRNYENMSKFLEPVAKDNASQLNLNITVNGNVDKLLSINSMETNALQNTFRKKIEGLQETSTGLKEKVLFYWYQARNELESQVGDKAIIESISHAPVKAIIEESIKAHMLSGDESMFKLAYVVDIDVETINGKPKIYKVINLHETFPREDS